MNDEARRQTSEGFISMLYFANPAIYEPVYEVVKKNREALSFDIENNLKIFREPLNRPTSFPYFQTENFEFSILGLNELFVTRFNAKLSGGLDFVNFRNARNGVTHA